MPAQSESYAIASGEVLSGGRFYAHPSAALMGDSLTADSYGLTSFYTYNGANGGKLKLGANCGVSGHTIENMLSRMHNLYTDALPGFAGIAESLGVSKLGFAIVMAGTNNIRSGGSFPTVAATSLLNALAGYATRVIILAIPPVANATGNTNSIAANVWLAAFAAANPSVFTFIASDAPLRHADGTQIASYFVDDVHLVHSGVAAKGAVEGDALASLLANYPSPLSTDPADIYPAQAQWVRNPLMTGAAGGKSGSITGTVATSYGLSGSDVVAVASIVAADVGDPNQTPWQRIAITAATGSPLLMSCYNQGRAMSASDPSSIETIAECRLTSVNTTKVTSFRSYIQADTTEFISPESTVDFKRVESLTKTYVMRNRRKRTGATSPTSLNIYLILGCGTFTGGTGTVDIRCVTARG